MPTIMTHALAGAVVARLMGGVPLRSPLAAAAATCAMLPDADVAGLALGIAYGEMWGHRGLSHSLAFAAAMGGAAYGVSRRSGAQTGASLWRTGASIFLATASHGALDALTNGGRGVAFFAPFLSDRYFFPWTPIRVSPIGFGIFSARGVAVLLSELAWVWAPCVLLLAALRLRGRRASDPS